ncbi:MAG: hypothetical protein Q9195_009014 [Heterodermia aff. obscurata]
MAHSETMTQENWTKKAEGKSSVLTQLRDFRSQIPKEKLAQWEEPTGNGSLLTIPRDWITVLAGTQLYIYQPGVRWNDIIANAFLAPAFVTTARLQRQQHSAHHHYLGTKADPDHGLGNATSLKHYRVGKTDHTSILSLFLYDVVDAVAFYNYAVGSLFEVPVQMITWWTASSLLAGFLEPRPQSSFFGPLQFGWNFFLLYHFSRCSLTYIFYILRESIDHSGLQPTGILHFSRNTPCCNWFQYFLQPHEDCYHLLHHLLPRVPVTRLHEAHVWLTENNEAYEKTNRYTTYFEGENPLFAEIPKIATGIEVDADSEFVMSQREP